jgi:hypothetical protein
MNEPNKKAPVALVVFLVGVAAVLAFLSIRLWLERNEDPQQGGIPPAGPVASAPGLRSEPLSANPSDAARISVDIPPARTEDVRATEEFPVTLEEPAQVPVTPPSPFPYGRPTPDWVFEQKYAGQSPSEIQLAKETIQAEYNLASKIAFNERFDAGDYEIIPVGQPTGGAPGDDRIISGRSMPNSPDTQLVRLNVDQYPRVYELFYEYLWLATQH